MTTTIPRAARAPGGRMEMGMGRILVMAAVACAALASPAAAQGGLAVEVRGGAGVGNYAEAASEFTVAPRPSFGATVSYAVLPAVEVYAGYSRTSFGCDGGFCSLREVTFTSSGVEAGVRAGLPLPASPWVRAGIVSHTLEFSSSPDEGEGVEGRSASGTGFEVGGGVEVRLGRRLAVTPGVRYVRYGAANDDGVAMLVGDVGLRIRM